MNFSNTTVVLAIGMVLSSALANAQSLPEKIYQPVSFEVNEHGSFGGKVIKELQTSEAIAIIRIGCSLFGVECSAAVTALTSARLAHGNKTGSEAHSVSVVPPVGYDICRVKLDTKNLSMTGESTFNGTISSADDPYGPNTIGRDMGNYVVVPKNRPSGQWVKATMYFEFTRKGEGALERNGCWPTNSHPWLCHHGPDSCSFYSPEARTSGAPQWGFQ